MSRFKVNASTAVFLLTGFLIQGELTAQIFRNCCCRQQQCCPQPCWKTDQCYPQQNSCQTTPSCCSCFLSETGMGRSKIDYPPNCILNQDRNRLNSCTQHLNPPNYDYQKFLNCYYHGVGIRECKVGGQNAYVIPDPCETCCSNQNYMNANKYNTCVDMCQERNGDCNKFGPPPTKCLCPCPPQWCAPSSRPIECCPPRGCFPRLRIFRRCR